MRHVRQTVAVAALTFLLVGTSSELLFAQRDPVVPLPPTCGVKLRAPVIRYELPNDVEGDLLQPNLNVVQRAVDIFSWQQFISLNWPAKPGERGVPDLLKPISAPGPRVWETWKEEYEVYLEAGVRPPGWNVPQRPPSEHGPRFPRVLFRRHKIHDVVDSTFQAAQTDGTLPPTLKDQNGNLVHYEIRMNKVMFDYIMENELYNGLKQAAFGGVSFPVGSIIVKAAWREVKPAEARHFLTTEALICESDPKTRRITHCDDKPSLMGLVGLHIMTKTPSAPQWIWSTFEQVHNVAGQRPSFYNPRTPEAPQNKQTAAGVPNQVTRVIPIPAKDPNCNQKNRADDNIVALNTAVQQTLLRNDSVLKSYELVNTQWPQQVQLSPVQPVTVFAVRPEILANTTMETFVQPTSTCMGCHSRARTLDTDAFASSDFTFTLNNAEPKPANPWIIPQPTKPKTAWDELNWPLIQNGLYLTEHTYEADETKDFVGSKLHCASCHLSAGRDPTAAWWVGMTEKYDYPATTNLQDRINQCFRRSMNGKDICSTTSKTDNCETNAPMQSLITYMQWIDAQFSQRLVGTPANGFPQIPKLTGNYDRGASIYLQKCAVCHGLKGQGRYASDTYFRPALWGPHSFNANAGMDKPEKAAPFIKANMPLGAGGMLSDQEAWDLATFIDRQSRPAGTEP